MTLITSSNVSTNVWSHWRLVQQSLLWNKIRLGLHSTHPRHIDAGVHEKALAEIQVLHAKLTPILPLLTVPQAIRCNKAQAPLPVDISPKLSPEEIKEIQRIVGSILYPHLWHHCPHGIELNSHWSNKGDNKHNEECKATFGLPCHQPWCNHTIPSLRHNHECTFGCALPVWIRCSHLRIQTFFYGLVCKRWQPHRIEWGLFYLMCHTLIHCCVPPRSRTWRPLLKLQRGKNWDTPSPKFRFIATTQLPSVLQTTLSRDSTRNLWKWDISGCVIKFHKIRMM